MPTSDVSIVWTPDQQSLLFVFPPMLTQAAAEEAIDQWTSALDKREEETTLIWDCSEMKDYDPTARILWQKALSKQQKKIKSIWLISESKVIRMAAKLLAMFVKLKIRPVSSPTEIPAIPSLARPA